VQYLSGLRKSIDLISFVSLEFSSISLIILFSKYLVRSASENLIIDCSYGSM
jgi:hypothetical protein